jgi:PAS domain S-box-containing protein
MEIVRVDFNDGNPIIVPNEQLQSKAKRYYFEDTFVLAQGEVFVSPMDLNIEHGEIEQPLKQMVRFGTPIFDPDGHKRGVVILNYFAKYMTHHLELTPGGHDQIMLLNSDGYWLHSPNPEDEWGFIYPEKEDRTFGNAYPEAWLTIATDESGQFFNTDGLFTFVTIYPLLEGQESSTGSSSAFEPSAQQIGAKEYYWKLVAYAPSSVLSAATGPIANRVLLVFGLMVVIVAGGSGVGARAMVRRKQAEEKLRQAEVKYRSIFENAVEGIFQTTRDGRYLTANPALANIYGYKSPEELLVSVTDIEHQVYVEPDRRAEFIRLMEEHGEVSKFEFQVYRKDGSVIWISESARAVRDESGAVRYYEGTVEDISERKRAEEELALRAEELARSNSELDDFSYVVSHDLKEPLRGIEAFSGFLAEDYGDKLDEQGQRYISVLRESAVGMRDLIEDLLQLSRIGRAQHEYGAVAVESLLEDVHRDLGFALKEKKVDLRLQADLPTITCDQVRLREVFKNLISNAIKFNDKPRPVVEVACRQDDGVYTFSVRDNGIGIDEQYQEKIFGIFQRLNRREEYEGTGAGLTICKKIVEAHGGKIWVESKDGQGATFSFTIPKKIQQTEEAKEKHNGRRSVSG